MQRQQIKEVLKQASPSPQIELTNLVHTVQNLLNEDIARDDLLIVLDDYRQGLDEQSENLVLDVMDRLEGNCTPQQRL